MPRPSEIAADARALYGPVATRPAAADMGDGALWVDPGAGHALYQVQSGNWVTISPGEAGGTVTSVGLSTSGLLHSVAGSPVTGSGTLSLDLKTQVHNTVLAGPASGADALPTMRSLVAADIPSLDASALGSGTLALARLSGITGAQLAVSAPTSGQIGGLTTSNLSSTAALVAGQITSVNPSALTGSGTVPLAALSGITTSQLSSTAGIVSGQIASVAASTLTGSNTLPDGVLSTNVPLLNVNNAFTTAGSAASSGTPAFFSITPTLTQSGTAGYTGLKVNATETSTGSGSKLLADFQVGGVSKASINDIGGATFADDVTCHYLRTGSAQGVVTNLVVDTALSKPYLDFNTSNQLLVNLRSASNSLVVKGASSQSGDLTQWQNSGGTVLAKVDASGNLTAQALTISPATTTTAPSAGAAGALPATPTGYATVTVNGSARQIAYY